MSSYYERHREEALSKANAWRAEHPEYNKVYYHTHKEQAQERDCRITLETMAVLGSTCIMCGESDPAVLEFDHINNDGHLHRIELTGRNGSGNDKKFKAWIRENPQEAKERVQLLCANCHRRKHSIFRNCTE